LVLAIRKMLAAAVHGGTLMKAISVLGVGFLCALTAQTVVAQDQITVTTPLQSINDGFSENFGIGFGFSGRGFFFNNGGGLGAAAPFGPPPSGASFGGGGRVGNVNFGWNAFAGQGSSRSMVMESPSLTMMNGTGGFFFNGSVRPFVMGIVPVVAANSISPIELALQRLAERGGLQRSIAERHEQRLKEEPVVENDRPPLQKEDDPPLILRGSGKKK
jgi:hypothetical protein